MFCPSQEPSCIVRVLTVLLIFQDLDFNVLSEETLSPGDSFGESCCCLISVFITLIHLISRPFQQEALILPVLMPLTIESVAVCSSSDMFPFSSQLALIMFLLDVKSVMCVACSIQ